MINNGGACSSFQVSGVSVPTSVPASFDPIDENACSSSQVRVDDSLLELISNPEMPMCSSSKDATERNTSVTTGNSHYIYVMCHRNYVRTRMLIAYVSRVLQNLIMI